MYQISLIAVSMLCIGLLAFMGISAVQKSMRLKVSFNATPSIYVEVKLAKITNGVTGTFEPIFNNSGTPTLGTGITLTGNKLTITENFTTANSIGASFKLQITNLMSENGLKASFSGTGAAADTEYVVMKEYSTSNTDDTAEVTVSGNSASSIFEIIFSEYNEYAVAVSPSSGNFTYTANPVAISGENYTATIKAKPGYNLSITVTRDDGTETELSAGIDNDYVWDSSTGALTIYARAVTGDITINCLNDNAISYTISYILDGGTVAQTNPTVYTVETATFTLNNPTKTGYNFAGWTGSNGNTAQTSVSIANGSTGNRSYTANWTLHTYTITYDLDGGTLATGETNPTSYTVESADIILKEPTKDGHTFLGWTGSNGSTAQTSVTITNGSTGDKSYTATWKANTYTIKFELKLQSGGTYPAEAGKIGILITNNSSLSFSLTRGDDGYLCCESSNNSSVQLYHVTSGTYPIRDAFNGDGYEYIEKYYNETPTGQTLEHESTVYSGYDIYIFFHSLAGGPNGEPDFSSYSDGGVSSCYNFVIKYTPTSSMTIKTTSYYANGGMSP